MGVALIQKDDDCNEQVISWFSKRHTSVEKSYTENQREFLARFFAVV